MSKMKFLMLTAVAMAVILTAGTASAALLVYEPFAYADGWLQTDGSGGALGTIGTWNAGDTVSGDWRIHQEGDLSGVTVDATGTVPNTFDGTMAFLATTGGYVGTPGPLDIGQPANYTGEPSRWMNADIGLDPTVTATFESQTTTWISYVSARGWYKNEEHPNLTLGTIPAPDQSRGDNYGGVGTGGDGFGSGGGPTRNNRTDIYPMYYDAGQYVNSTGLIAGNSYGDSAHEVPNADAFDWAEFRANGDFGPPNLVVMKLEWDADTGGADIISVVRFLEADGPYTEAAFDALIAATPNLSSANWSDNKPDIDQSTLAYLTFMGTKVFADEIRLGTTFGDVTPIPEPMTLALLGLGGLGLIRRRRRA